MRAATRDAQDKHLKRANNARIVILTKACMMHGAKVRPTGGLAER
jgi:hypothetical protein